MADRKTLAAMKQWLAETPEEIPFRMVEFWPEGWSHGHNYFGALDESYEDIADGLAQAILDCNDSRHKGHGSTHGGGSAQDAYFSAISQILNGKDRESWAELRKNIRHYILWGDHAPAVVFTPNKDSDEWDAIVKHPETGEATVYPVSQEIDMPSPREIGATPNPSGPGFLVGE